MFALASRVILNFVSHETHYHILQSHDYRSRASNPQESHVPLIYIYIYTSMYIYTCLCESNVTVG
jgi:hypothetical protein